MRKTALAYSLVVGLVGLAGCPDVGTDTGEGNSGPTVQFDPANSIIPFPNNLVLDPATGKVKLPQQCGETPAQGFIRQTLLNTLDGFGAYESALQVTFTEPVDMASLDGKVLIYQRAKGATPNDPAGAQPVPIAAFIPGKSTQFTADCSSSAMVDNVTIIPQGVLASHSTYDVVLLTGIKTASGTDFGPAFTWALIDQDNDPVTLDDQMNVVGNRTPLDPSNDAQKAQLLGIDQLWKAHKQGLDFVAAAGHARSDVVLAFEFTTQTTTDPLDPAAAGSPASAIGTAPLAGTQSVLPAGVTAAQFLTNKGIPCGQLPCDKIADILISNLPSKNYQADGSNPLTGGIPVPGPWSDPVHPAVVHGDRTIQTLIAIPANVAPPWPTVVFGHGLGSSSSSMFAIAPQLAAQGFAVVAIDFVDHGGRAIKTSDDAAKGCSGAVDPTVAPQCFALFLSADLATTRDNIRQTVLDLEALVAAIKACGPTGCGALKVDPDHIVYAGISLGGIIGSTTVANVPDFKAAVLNVPGVGLIDVLENTANLTIRCTLVDALISVGVLMGDKFNPGAGTGLCTTDAWKAQEGYQRFAAIGRWALDPADGANFTPKLATRRILIQEVVDDQVVPNVATNREAALVGLAAATADPAISAAPQPSMAITTNGMSNKFVKYPTLPADAGTGFPGNTFAHPSLLRPSKNGVDGTCGTPDCGLGTARLQSDAITFLLLNK